MNAEGREQSAWGFLTTPGASVSDKRELRPGRSVSLICGGKRDRSMGIRERALDQTAISTKFALFSSAIPKQPKTSQNGTPLFDHLAILGKGLVVSTMADQTTSPSNPRMLRSLGGNRLQSVKESAPFSPGELWRQTNYVGLRSGDIEVSTCEVLEPFVVEPRGGHQGTPPSKRPGSSATATMPAEKHVGATLERCYIAVSQRTRRPAIIRHLVHGDRSERERRRLSSTMVKCYRPRYADFPPRDLSRGTGYPRDSVVTREMLGFVHWSFNSSPWHRTIANLRCQDRSGDPPDHSPKVGAGTEVICVRAQVSMPQMLSI